MSEAGSFLPNIFSDRESLLDPIAENDLVNKTAISVGLTPNLIRVAVRTSLPDNLPSDKTLRVL